MKKILILIAVLSIVSCKKDVKNFVSIKGRLKNANISQLKIQGNNYTKEIKVADDGTFSDTLKITSAGIHILTDGNQKAALFLRDGYDLNLDFNGSDISKGISFSGNGSETNNFLDNKRSFFMSDLANPKTYFELDEDAYEAKIKEAKDLLKSYKDKAPQLDTLVSQMDSRNDDMFFGYIAANYQKMHANLTKLAIGVPSPQFKDYENFNGGKTSLSDFKGKYVYIDVWATWCAPCKAEIPFLKELDKEYKGKNIAFVSISVDRRDAYDTWRKMIKDEQMGGNQLFADNNFESSFVMEYGIDAIPRFILLDPKGNIISPDAPRPSDPKLKVLFKELGI